MHHGKNFLFVKHDFDIKHFFKCILNHILGGYKEEGAWTNTVEFFNFEKGAWTPFPFFPQLTNGRHYHGLTTLGKTVLYFH